MATSALNQNINTAAGLAQLASALFGKGDTTTTRSGGTTTSTKQTQISQEGLKSLIQSMLEDQSTGLAKVASGGRASGIYNASTQQLLVNDLISRASNAAALASSPTTTTTTSPKVTETSKQAGMLGSGGNNLMLPLLGAGLLLKKDASGKSMFDTLSGAVGGFFGNDAAASSNFVLGDASPLGGTITALSSDVLSPMSDSAFQLGTLSDLVSSVIGGDGSLGDIINNNIIDLGSSAIGGAGYIVTSLKDNTEDIADIIGGWFA